MELEGGRMVSGGEGTEELQPELGQMAHMGKDWLYPSYISRHSLSIKFIILSALLRMQTFINQVILNCYPQQSTVTHLVVNKSTHRKPSLYLNILLFLSTGVVNAAFVVSKIIIIITPSICRTPSWLNILGFKHLKHIRETHITLGLY